MKTTRILRSKTSPQMAFTKEYISFFKQLSANNTSEGVNASKKRYEQLLKAPFYQLVSEVIGEMKKDNKTIHVEPKTIVCSGSINFVTRPDLSKFIVEHYKVADEWNKFLFDASGKK